MANSLNKEVYETFLVNKWSIEKGYLAECKATNLDFGNIL